MRHLALLAPVVQFGIYRALQQCTLETAGEDLGLDSCIDPEPVSALCSVVPNSDSAFTLRLAFARRQCLAVFPRPGPGSRLHQERMPCSSESSPVPDTRHTRHNVRLDNLGILQDPQGVAGGVTDGTVTIDANKLKESLLMVSAVSSLSLEPVCPARRVVAPIRPGAHSDPAPGRLDIHSMPEIGGDRTYFKAIRSALLPSLVTADLAAFLGNKSETLGAETAQYTPPPIAPSAPSGSYHEEPFTSRDPFLCMSPFDSWKMVQIGSEALTCAPKADIHTGSTLARSASRCLTRANWRW